MVKAKAPALQGSLVIHLILVLPWIGLSIWQAWLNQSKTISIAEFQVIEKPRELKTEPKPIQLRKSKPVLKQNDKPREVFGISKNAITGDSGGVDVKMGNTVAKAPDELVLRKDDETALPVPREEYLVTRMPRLKSEVRISYPPGARERRVQGAVQMDLLIDQNGKVRETKLVQGIDPELDAAALEALKKFEFEPAAIDAAKVAVRIRYSYRFVLE